MSLRERSEYMRACGKQYGSVDEAKRSKNVRENGHEVVTGCPCGKVHTRKPLRPGRQSLAQRPQGRKDGIPDRVRKIVLKRDGFACVCCGASIIGQRYSLAHRVRAAQGGKPVPENLVVLLGWGGELHHGRVDLYRDPEDGIGKKGYRLPSTADPAMEPVWVVSAGGGGTLVWLTSGPEYSLKPPNRRAA